MEDFRWGEDELRFIDQYTCLGVEISMDCSWDCHITKVIGKGKSQVGKDGCDPNRPTRTLTLGLKDYVI